MGRRGQFEKKEGGAMREKEPPAGNTVRPGQGKDCEVRGSWEEVDSFGSLGEAKSETSRLRPLGA